MPRHYRLLWLAAVIGPIVAGAAFYPFWTALRGGFDPCGTRATDWQLWLVLPFVLTPGALVVGLSRLLRKPNASTTVVATVVCLALSLFCVGVAFVWWFGVHHCGE